MMSSSLSAMFEDPFMMHHPQNMLQIQNGMNSRRLTPMHVCVCLYWSVFELTSASIIIFGSSYIRDNRAHECPGIVVQGAGDNYSVQNVY